MIMSKDVAKGKLVKIIAIWDNEDGTMTTFSGTSKGLVVNIENQVPPTVEIAQGCIIYGPDTIKKVSIGTDLVVDSDTGRYGKFEKESIPEF